MPPKRLPYHWPLPVLTYHLWGMDGGTCRYGRACAIHDGSRLRRPIRQRELPRGGLRKPQGPLTVETVRAIRESTEAAWVLAERYEVSTRTISRIRARRVYTDPRYDDPECQTQAIA